MIDVVAAVIKKNNKYFIAKRNRHKHFALHWEFPGGKVDNDESFEQALKREIYEELSINIKIKEKITSEKYKDDKIDVEVHYFLCEVMDEEIILSEHEDMKWLFKKDLLNFKLAPGDSKIINYL
jgi:8-oxo-dGTP diphosphatase